jgi:hypothetical protein
LANLHVIAGLDCFLRHATIFWRGNLCVFEIQLGLFYCCFISFSIRFRSRRGLNCGVAFLCTDAAFPEKLERPLLVLLRFMSRCLRFR